MKRNRFILGAGALFLAASLTACGGGPSQKEAPSAKGKWTVAYADSSSEADVDTAAFLKEGKFLEGVTEGLNATLNLEKDFPLKAQDCDEPGAHFDPGKQEIVFCYQLATILFDVFKDAEDLDTTVMGVMNTVAYHEVGHALVNLYDLPVTGKQEDAVDQLSAAILLESDNDDMILSTSDWHGAMAANQTEFDKLSFAGVHSLNDQRQINLLCWAYGKDPKKYAALVSPDVLPEERAGRCEGEYQQVVKSWDKLLEPHFKA